MTLLHAMSHRRPITATYRLQLRGPNADEQQRSFTFYDAAELLPYLNELGISHIYLSPILEAPAHSAHNYDVTNPTAINPELGGAEGFCVLARAAQELNIGIIIDIVPNHLGVDDPTLNPWWWDVLSHGRDSAYESYFDIDWHEDNGAGGRLGLPILGSKEDIHALRIIPAPKDFPAVEAGTKVLAYYDTFFPIAPGTLVEDDPVATHDAQHYRLMYWRDGVNSYRRFFSVNGLAGVRQEDPTVFDHTHRVLQELLEEDLIDGVRVDHPDGLSNPFGYLKKLRELIGPDRWLVIEKILSVDEPLDPRLAVDGTTGYDALRELDGVFIARDAEAPLSMLALEQSGSTWDQAAIDATEQQLKAQVAREELMVEVRRLARAIRHDNFSTAGALVSEEELIDTIVDLVAEMPVYRADYLSLSRVTASVIADMSRRFPTRRRALDLVSAALIAEGEAKVRFAQVCGAVMAKGVEDTTFYRACRLVALQEVGGAPGRFGVSAAEFHLLQQERARLWPHTMTTLSTHDTKRSEDVRARIIELSECPDRFAELSHSVSAIVPAPDAATGHFLLQNLLGIWPADGEISTSLAQRFRDYAIKTAREAGVHTTWVDPDEGFEKALCNWVDALIDGPVSPLITELARYLAPGAQQISLSRKLLQLIGPGIPDIYQGTEFFDDSLVDPDNRRFVDYTARQQTLQLIKAGVDWQTAATELAHTDEEGSPRWYRHLDTMADRAKLSLIHQALHVRRERPELFEHGHYQAVFAVGPAEAHVVGLARGLKEDEIDVIAIGVRRPLALMADPRGWEETTITLPAGHWVDRLTGRRWEGPVDVPAEEVFAIFPAALMLAG